MELGSIKNGNKKSFKCDDKSEEEIEPANIVEYKDGFDNDWEGKETIRENSIAPSN